MATTKATKSPPPRPPPYRPGLLEPPAGYVRLWVAGVDFSDGDVTLRVSRERGGAGSPGLTVTREDFEAVGACWPPVRGMWVTVRLPAVVEVTCPKARRG